MKKLIKILLSVNMLFTCFGMNVFANEGPEDLVVESSTEFVGNQNNKECGNFKIVSEATLTLTRSDDESPRIDVFGDIDIKGTLVPCQDATIRVQPGHDFVGIQFYDPSGQTDITNSIEEAMDFVYIADNVNKWVQFVEPLEDKTFEENSTIDDWSEFGKTTINNGVTVSITNGACLCVRGDFTNNGILNPELGARIAIDNGAFDGIVLYDTNGTDQISSPVSEYTEFRYNGEKWVKFVVEDITFNNTTIGSTSNPDHTLYDWNEYNNVTIESAVYVKLADKTIQEDTIHCGVYIHGNYSGSGHIFGDIGAHLMFDHVENAFGEGEMGSHLFDSNGNNFVDTPTGFMEFEYNGQKWIEFVPPQNPRFAVFCDANVGKVYHYADDVFTEITPQTEPFEYDVTDEDKLYILANPGWVYDRIEAEGEPAVNIINKEKLDDETIEGVTYKVVKVTPNQKDDNFYYFEIKFIEDPAIEFINKLNTLELAFDSTTAEANSYAKLKEYIAHNIYSKYLESGSRYHIENTVFEGIDFDTFKGKVEIVTDNTQPSKEPAQINGSASTYFKYKLNGLDNFVGIVYKLNGTDEFILRDGDTYTIVDVSDEAKEASEGKGAAALKDYDAVSGGKIVVRKINNTVNIEESQEGPNYEIFGNYAGFPMNYTGWMQDFQDTSHISIERVWPCVPNGENKTELEGIFSGLCCEMILYSNDFVGVSIKSDKKAKPWSKDNLPIYPTNSNLEEATVFYASSFVEIATPYAPNSIVLPTITNVTFEGGATSWNGCDITDNGDTFTITFGSIFYDKVPLKITYSNGTTNSFVLARTGISIGDYPAPGGGNSVEVCGETVTFTDDNKWLIATPFYYDSQSPSRVSLFVRITDNDGNVVTKLVTNTINNSNIHTDDSGYTYNKYDVFELWRGMANNRPKEIEVIAFVQGDDNNFGGVKLGAGNGVKWTQERGRQ